VVVSETRPAPRQHPGRHRTGRPADPDLRCATRPERDTIAVRTHAEIVPALPIAAVDLRTLGDLVYEGEAGPIIAAARVLLHITHGRTT
jgi:hypothetical protein